jgi:hypothetical protein
MTYFVAFEQSRLIVHVPLTVKACNATLARITVVDVGMSADEKLDATQDLAEFSSSSLNSL